MFPNTESLSSNVRRARKSGDLISHRLCFQNMENMLKVNLLISLCLSVRLPARNNLGTAEQIIMKLNIRTFS